MGSLSQASRHSSGRANKGRNGPLHPQVVAKYLGAAKYQQDQIYDGTVDEMNMKGTPQVKRPFYRRTFSFPSEK